MTARNLLYEVSLFLSMYFCLPIFPNFKSCEIWLIKGTVLTTRNNYMEMSVTL